MNLKEQLQAKRDELVGLKGAIEAGDAEAIERADAIASDIEGIEAQVAKAEKASAMLAKLGNAESKQVKENDMTMSLGEFAAKNLDVAKIKGVRNASVATPEFKTGSQSYLNMSVEQVTESRTVTSPTVDTPVRDAFGTESIEGNAYSWVVFGAPSGEHEPTDVGEADNKPELDNVYFKLTEPLVKYAGWFKDTDELLEDNAYLATAIENRGVYRLKKATENELASEIADYAVSGVTNGNLTAASAGTEAIASASATADQFANAIYAAIMDVKAASGADCDAVIVTSALAQLLRTGQDGNGQYYGGGYFTGAYGQPGGYQMMPNLWGLKVIVSDAISNDAHAVVGNFRQGATVIGKRGGGVRVEATNANEDDFIHDLVTIRLEERLLLAVREPAMFAAVIED